MNKFSSKISYIIITFFLGAIVVSFALTGFQGFNASSDAVGKVDGTPITISEYRNTLNAELSRFSQMFGGKDLNAAQIRQFRIKEGVLNKLVQQKLIQNLAKDMKLDSSLDEIKDIIKKSPIFLTNEKFDVNKYKAILSQNQFSPAKYEELVQNDISTRKVTELFATATVSDGYAKDLLKFKNTEATVTAVEFNKEDMTEFIPVSSSEIKAFIADEKNKSILEGLFKSMTSEFNKEARVKARHILIKSDGKKSDANLLKEAKAIRAKVNRSNFAKIAGKETQDPSGKGAKGGDLGWFSKGRMVPEFEKAAFSMKPGQISQPIKTSFGYHIILVEDSEKAVTKSFDEVKDVVAKKHLQKSNRKALTTFTEELTADLSKALKENQTSKLKSLAKKYNITLLADEKVNQYDQKVGTMNFSSEKIGKIFTNRDANFVEENGPMRVSLLKVSKISNEDETIKAVEKEIKDEKIRAQNALASNIQNDLIKYLQAEAKVVTYPNML